MEVRGEVRRTEKEKVKGAVIWATRRPREQLHRRQRTLPPSLFTCLYQDPDTGPSLSNPSMNCARFRLFYIFF